MELESSGSSGVAEKTTSEASTVIFYPRLESLRGVAALMVAAYHSWESTWLDSNGQVRNFLSASRGQDFTSKLNAHILCVIGNGYGAVVLFFVISGFVLSASLSRGPQNLLECGLRFLSARLFRIYPAVFATVAVFAALYWTTGAFINWPGAYAPLGLLRNALLIDISIDGVTWSLQLELAAIPLIVLAFLGWRRWGFTVPVTLFLCLAGLSFWNPWNRALGYPNLFGSIHAFLPGMMAFFLAPILLGRCTPRVSSLAFVGATLGFLASRRVLGVGSHWSSLTEAIFGAIVVAILAFGRPGPLGRVFDISFIRFFGRISYSFYLLHPLTLMVMWKIPAIIGGAIKAGIPPIGMAAFLFIGSTAAVTPLAFAMYRWVEMPGVAAGRKFTRSMSREKHPRELYAGKNQLPAKSL